MHYIRFLKPPQISWGILTAKITITTDLGDDFLNADLPLQLILHHSIHKDTVIGKPPYHPNIVHWKAGSRELAVSIPLPKKEQIPKEHGVYEWQLLVWPCLTGQKPQPVTYNKKGKPIPLPPPGTKPPKPPSYDETDSPLTMEDILKINRGSAEDFKGVKGLVLAAESATFNLVDAEQKLPAVIERDFGMDMWDDEFTLTIEEETGNSIARHVWDAGVVFSALLCELCIVPNKRSAAPSYLPELYKVLETAHNPEEDSIHSSSSFSSCSVAYSKGLSILELGTGCAIVTAALSLLLPLARILATDMPEATEIAEKNLKRNRTGDVKGCDRTVEKKPDADSSYEVLDWTEELPGRVGGRKWDLVLVADCTYNSDVVPALVNTLRRLVDKSPEVLIAVALKWRHDSEAIFHELMKEHGMRQVDKHTERCGNFDVDATGKEEEIEVYLFKGAVKTEEKQLDEGKEEQNEVGRKRKLHDGKEEGVAKK